MSAGLGILDAHDLHGAAHDAVVGAEAAPAENGTGPALAKAVYPWRPAVTESAVEPGNFAAGFDRHSRATVGAEIEIAIVTVTATEVGSWPRAGCFVVGLRGS